MKKKMEKKVGSKKTFPKAGAIKKAAMRDVTKNAINLKGSGARGY